jgi:hypothetical protein
MLEGQLPPPPPATEPSALDPVTETATEIGNRLRPSSDESTGETQPADDGESGESDAIAPDTADDGRGFPGLGDVKPVTYSLGATGTTTTTTTPAPPRARRSAAKKKRR